MKKYIISGLKDRRPKSHIHIVFWTGVENGFGARRFAVEYDSETAAQTVIDTYIASWQNVKVQGMDHEAMYLRMERNNIENIKVCQACPAFN